MRSEARLPLTLEEHTELGEQLRQTRMRMQELCALVLQVYGPESRAAFSFQKVSDALNRLCADLRTQALEDLPGRAPDGLYP